MKTKTCAAKVKSLFDQGNDGEFEAIVSVFDNIDTYGDVVRPGAFTNTLREWATKGDPIPVLWSHDWQDPFSHIGIVVEAKETERGLWVKGQLDLDNPKANQVHKLLKGGRVKQFSFAYDILDGTYAKDEAGNNIYELNELRLHEVGPCLVGVNQDTELLAVKSQTLTVADRAAIVAEVVAELKTTPTGEQPSQGEVPPTDDEPEVKSDVATPNAPLMVKAESTIILRMGYLP